MKTAFFKGTYSENCLLVLQFNFNYNTTCQTIKLISNSTPKNTSNTSLHLKNCVWPVPRPTKRQSPSTVDVATYNSRKVQSVNFFFTQFAGTECSMRVHNEHCYSVVQVGRMVCRPTQHSLSLKMLSDDATAHSIIPYAGLVITWPLLLERLQCFKSNQ